MQDIIFRLNFLEVSNKPQNIFAFLFIQKSNLFLIVQCYHDAYQSMQKFGSNEMKKLKAAELF